MRSIITPKVSDRGHTGRAATMVRCGTRDPVAGGWTQPRVPSVPCDARVDQQPGRDDQRRIRLHVDALQGTQRHDADICNRGLRPARTDVSAREVRRLQGDNGRALRTSCAAQFPWAREVVEALGIPIVEVPEFEADDVIGTLAQKGEAAGTRRHHPRPATSTRCNSSPSMCACIASRRGISETIIYDLDKVRERYGFEPPLVVDFKALQGDTSDNIPGRPRHRREDGDVARATVRTTREGARGGAVDAHGRVRRALEQHVEQARLSKWTATIVVDVDVDIDLDAARLFHYDETRFASSSTGSSSGVSLAATPRQERSTPMRRRRRSLLQPTSIPVGDLQASDDRGRRRCSTRTRRRMRSNVFAPPGSFALRTVLEGNPRTGDLIGVATFADRRRHRVLRAGLALESRRAQRRCSGGVGVRGPARGRVHSRSAATT